MGKGQAPLYIEQVSPDVFVASSAWPGRAHHEARSGVTWVFPHPLDILVSKMRRCAEKDIKAFRLVIERTGHPTEAELIRGLQGVVDMFRPAFDEENPGGDAVANTRYLWQTLFGHDIDVRAEIIAPALAVRRAAYGLEDTGHRAELRRRLEEE